MLRDAELTCSSRLAVLEVALRTAPNAACLELIPSQARHSKHRFQHLAVGTLDFKRKKENWPRSVTAIFLRWGGSWIFMGKGLGGTAVCSRDAQSDATSYHGHLLKVPPGFSQGCLLRGDTQHGFPPCRSVGTGHAGGPGHTAIPIPAVTLSTHMVDIKAPGRPILQLYLCHKMCPMLLMSASPLSALPAPPQINALALFLAVVWKLMGLFFLFCFSFLFSFPPLFFPFPPIP